MLASFIDRAGPTLPSLSLARVCVAYILCILIYSPVLINSRRVYMRKQFAFALIGGSESETSTFSLGLCVHDMDDDFNSTLNI